MLNFNNHAVTTFAYIPPPRKPIMEQQLVFRFLDLPFLAREAVYGIVLQDTIPVIVDENRHWHRSLYRDYFYDQQKLHRDFGIVSSKADAKTLPAPANRHTQYFLFGRVPFNQSASNERIKSNILLSCKQIYHEALPLLYKNRIFFGRRINIYGLPPATRQRIRHFHDMTYMSMGSPREHLDFLSTNLPALQTYQDVSAGISDLDQEYYEVWNACWFLYRNQSPAALSDSSHHTLWEFFALFLQKRGALVQSLFRISTFRKLEFYFGFQSAWVPKSGPATGIYICMSKIDASPPIRPRDLVDVSIRVNWRSWPDEAVKLDEIQHGLSLKNFASPRIGETLDNQQFGACIQVQGKMRAEPFWHSCSGRFPLDGVLETSAYTNKGVLEMAGLVRDLLLR
ncbi:hypothetical protein QBC35DRAFT_178404 [Podospora australis]|uniref:Uncharacterized protein n=1 Tax=Podospora australis TaxID=1536484 RepID=A0AAN6WJG2_9PEZI|nr:hypothetical protein QBC35DRAFT_178404 [Podospora australis]